MIDFMALYDTETKCRRALFKSRWRKGFRCPTCSSRRSSRFQREGQSYYERSACRHQTTLISGTMFEATKLRLQTWFLALHLLTSTKTRMAALELMRPKGVGYSAAWRIKHKVMQAMTRREESRKLKGFVQIDDAYLGAERNGGKSGRGSENKQALVIAVETDEAFQRPKHAVIEPGRSITDVAGTDCNQRCLMPQTEVFGDGLGAFRRCADQGHAHTVLVTKGGRAATQVDGVRWVNTLLSNVKRSIGGTYHSIKQ